jgi:transcriptional regulator with XRE-family HTH domain
MNNDQGAAALDGYDEEDVRAVLADDHDDDEPTGRGDRSPTELDKLLGKTIRELRNRRPKTALAPLAARLTPMTPDEPWYVKRIQRLELGERRISVNDLDVILRGLGITWLEFMRAAELVRVPNTTKDCIAVDPTLDSRARRDVLNFYKLAQDSTSQPEDD